MLRTKPRPLNPLYQVITSRADHDYAIIPAGSIYFREMMREKCRIRDNIKRLRLEKGDVPPKPIRRAKYSPKPRSIQQLKVTSPALMWTSRNNQQVAIQNYSDYEREWESKMLQKAMKELEEEETKDVRSQATKIRGNT